MLSSNRSRLALFVAAFSSAFADSHAADGVFVRFRLIKPAGAKYYIKLGGFVHEPNWYLPTADIPASAEMPNGARATPGCERSKKLGPAR